MAASDWGHSDFRRVVAIGGVTGAVMAALFLANPFHSTATTSGPAETETIESAADQRPAADAVSFVTSQTIDTSAESFVGCGDGSNGYFGEQPKPVSKRD
jgi:curli biogenesis system outer membrane secretion channel CsgG